MPTPVTGDSARGVWAYCGADAPVTIPDFGFATVEDNPGSLAGYPISIDVRGVDVSPPGMIVNSVEVRLLGLTHANIYDVAILLTKPDRFIHRVRNGIVMGRCFGDNRPCSNANFEFRTGATPAPRLYGLAGDPVPGGAYEPRSYVSFRSDTQNPNGPGGAGNAVDSGFPTQVYTPGNPPTIRADSHPLRPPYNIGFADFIGAFAEGCWHLYIYDEGGFDIGGRLADWQLVLNGVAFGRSTQLVAGQPV